MKYLFTILILSITIYANNCVDLYNSFKTILEPQLTELCITKDNNTAIYKFYVNELSGYSDMQLTFSVNNKTDSDYNYYLYIKGEGKENPYVCGTIKLNRFQTIDDILHILMSVNPECRNMEFIN